MCYESRFDLAIAKLKYFSKPGGDALCAYNADTTAGTYATLRLINYYDGDIIRAYAGSIDPKVVLIDGEQLAEYMIDFGLGVSTTVAYDVKRIDSDFFVEE